jgi:hypothetical protein
MTDSSQKWRANKKNINIIISKSYQTKRLKTEQEDRSIERRAAEPLHRPSKVIFFFVSWKEISFRYDSYDRLLKKSFGIDGRIKFSVTTSVGSPAFCA